MVKINFSTIYGIILIIFFVLLGDSGSNTSKASTCSNNFEAESLDMIAQGVITIVDSDWSTFSQTSDCVSGWGDDIWELKLTDLTQIKNVTIYVGDCCCPGDYYEVYVDGNLIGITPNLAPPWGCDVSGPLSSGSFTVVLCPGTHIITVRDAGFDGHTQSEIEEKNMCPAGFTVAGTLSTYTQSDAVNTEEMFIPIQESTPFDPEVQELREQLEEIEPFIVINENGTQSLLTKLAKDAGVSGNSIALGHRMVAFNNLIIIKAKKGEKPSLTANDFAFIEPLFLEQAQQGSPCGDRRNPTPCPNRIDSGNFFSTEEEVKQHLISLGYHRTANYANYAYYRGGRADLDFTLVVPHPDCGSGPFRTEAVIYKQGPCWTYTTQGPEPNPEFLSYIGSWPYASWVGYVVWWHLVFC